MAENSENPPRQKTRGAQRTTRDDWIETAMDTLISDGIDSVKVSTLSAKLNCARSSFYWYFKNRRNLLDALLDQWQQQNTRAITSRANTPANSINMALVNVFSCWVTPSEVRDQPFDTKLDFDVRDWARRDGSVRLAVDISDDARIDALKGMFARYGYEEDEAAIRARVLYFTQIGYEALDHRDTHLDRAKTGANYLYCHTGQRPTEQEVKAIAKLTGQTLEYTRP